MGERICSVEGCDRPARTRGWCEMHYARVCRHGDTSKVIGNKGACAIDGCARPARALIWCQMHYHRLRRHGNPGPVGPLIRGRYRSDAACAVAGCGHGRYREAGAISTITAGFGTETRVASNE